MTNHGYLRATLRKKVKESMRSGRSYLVFALVVGLALVSVAYGHGTFKDDIEVATVGNHQARQQWTQQGEKNAHSAAHYGVYVFKTPTAGTIFDPGVLAFTGISVFMEAHFKSDATHQPILERTSLARFGELNPAYFLICLVPLLLFFTQAGSFSEESQLEITPIVASTGIGSRKWIFAKWVGAWPIPVVALLATMLPCIWLVPHATFQPSLWLGTLIGFVLFFGSMIHISLIVSSYCNSPRAALFVLLALWLAFVPALPRLAGNLAESQFPTPTVAEIRTEAFKAKEANLPQYLEALEAELLAKYEVDNLQDLPINFDGVRMQADEEQNDLANDKIYEDIQNTFAHHNQLYRKFSWLSPAIPMRFLSMAMAQTDAKAHWNFNTQAEQYRRDWVKFLNDEMTYNSKTGDWSKLSPESTWSEFPEFQYQAPTSQELLADSQFEMMVLVIWFLISGFWVFFITPRRIFRRIA